MCSIFLLKGMMSEFFFLAALFLYMLVFVCHYYDHCYFVLWLCRCPFIGRTQALWYMTYSHHSLTHTHTQKQATFQHRRPDSLRWHTLSLCSLPQSWGRERNGSRFCVKEEVCLVCCYASVEYRRLLQSSLWLYKTIVPAKHTQTVL